MPNSYKESYQSLGELAQDLRDSEKKSIILFAHNGIGKTSLSVTFKDIATSGGRNIFSRNIIFDNKWNSP